MRCGCHGRSDHLLASRRWPAISISNQHQLDGVVQPLHRIRSLRPQASNVSAQTRSKHDRVAVAQQKADDLSSPPNSSVPSLWPGKKPSSGPFRVTRRANGRGSNMHSTWLELPRIARHSGYASLQSSLSPSPSSISSDPSEHATAVICSSCKPSQLSSTGD